ncbi:MAG: rhodanese-like domain-containing protein, partial [Aquabacterium sp.]
MSTSSSFLADNWYWIVAAVGSGGVLLWQQIQGAASSGVTPAAAVQLVNKEKAQLIDVCEPAEFAQGHVPGAVNIPRGVLEFEVDGHPAVNCVKDPALSHREAPVVLMCRSGGRSALAADALRTLGFAH